MVAPFITATTGETDGGEKAIGDRTSPYHVRMSLEAASAIFSALLVAPLVSIVDKAIVSNASGRQALVPSLIEGTKILITRPVQFIKQRSFLIIWGVYSGTYIAANTISATCERSNQSEVVPKFVGSSIANVSLSIAKDAAFVRLFGTGTPRPVPVVSMGFFAGRDTMTVFASFTLPPVVSKKMQATMGTSAAFSDTAAQLLTPCAMQLISCPLHLYGLDKYNRPDVSIAGRIDFIKKEYLKTAIARIARILPAFGIGGVINNHLRTGAKQRFCKEGQVAGQPLLPGPPTLARLQSQV